MPAPGRPRPPASMQSPGRTRARAVRRKARWIGAALVGLSACSSSTISAPPELAISITATLATVAVNAEAEFRYQAAGFQLLRIEVSYGDGAEEDVGTLGASTAGGRLTHTYTAPGTYQVEATVVAGDGERLSDTATIEITP